MLETLKLLENFCLNDKKSFKWKERQFYGFWKGLNWEACFGTHQQEYDPRNYKNLVSFITACKMTDTISTNVNFVYIYIEVTSKNEWKFPDEFLQIREFFLIANGGTEFFNLK